MSCFKCLALNIYIGKKVKVRCPILTTENKTIQTYEIGTILCIDQDKMHVQFSKPINSIFQSRHLYNTFIYEITHDYIFMYDHIVGNYLWNITQIFKHLTFGNIKTIELDERNIKSFTVYTFDGMNENKENYTNTDVPNIQKNIVHSSFDYTYYRGYATFDNKLSNCENVLSTFGNELQNCDSNYQNTDRSYLDFINHLGLWILDKESAHPNIGQLVCGIVKNSRYIHWFSCSNQLYLLWILIMYGENNNAFLGKNKKQILDLLETSPHLKVVGSTQEKIKNYKFNNVEPSAKLYSDIYKSIAKIFYYNEDIPIYYYIPSINHNMLMCGIKTYRDYLLYVFG